MPSVAELGSIKSGYLRRALENLQRQGGDGGTLEITGVYAGTATPLPAGAVGDMWLIGTPVPTAAPNNPAGGVATAGDIIIRTATGWVNLGHATGPTGPAGVTGPTGATGPTGVSGGTGLNGVLIVGNVDGGSAAFGGGIYGFDGGGATGIVVQLVDGGTALYNIPNFDSIWPTAPFVCTSTTRPTGAAAYEGRTIYETDTDRLMVYDGTTWQVTYQAAPPTWIAPTLINSWVNYGAGEQNVQYRKIGDIVYLRGVIKTGAIGTVALNLPAGYRPPAPVAYAVSSAGAFGNLSVALNGDIAPVNGSNVSFHLNGVTFSVTA